MACTSSVLVAQVRFTVGEFMVPELPRCSMCRVKIQVGENLIFRPDGRVQHTNCPPVTCPGCGFAVLPRQPIRREGETMLHSNCWIKRLRAAGPTRAQ